MNKDKTIDALPDLLPCPFCDGKAKYEITITERTVQCTCCSAAIVRDKNTILPEHVWNRRPTLERAEAAMRKAQEENFLKDAWWVLEEYF